MVNYSHEQLQEMVSEVNSYSGGLEYLDYHNMDEIDDLLCNLKPSDILRMTHSEFNPNSDFFQIDSLGHLFSVSDYKLKQELQDNQEEIVENFIDTFGADIFINDYGINSIVINQISIEDFYELDNIIIDTDGFTFIDKDNDIHITVKPNEEVTEENFKDHLQEEFTQDWKELKQKVYDAYKEYENDL